MFFAVKLWRYSSHAHTHNQIVYPARRSSPQACRCMRCMQQTQTRAWTERSATPSCRLEVVTETGRTSTLMPRLALSRPLWNWIERNRPSTAWVCTALCVSLCLSAFNSPFLTERKRLPQLIIVARDMGQPVPYETTQPLQVALLDIDDNEPVFLKPPVRLNLLESVFNVFSCW